jgi:aldehyde dehydrogenase (NAD+)
MDTATDNAAPTAGIADVFERQQARARQWRTSTAAERIARIRKLLKAIEAYEYHLYLAAKADFGKPEAEVDLTELLPVIGEAKHTISHLKRWMKPRRVRPTLAMAGTSGSIRCEPKGVVLIMAPWNYPFNLAMGPLVSALAAGNTAIIKPSEMTPQVSALIRRIVEETFEPDEVAVFEGGVETATALLKLPFDHIFFTGSPAVGKIVMAAAARNLSSVTLELGGKSPTIVERSADIKKAARNIIWGKCTNNGQTCIAPDYLLVHNSIRVEFVEEAIRCLQHAYGHSYGEQLLSADYCRIVNDANCQRLLKLVDDARSRGANVVAGGRAEAAQRFIAPTLLVDVPPDAAIMQEEIFGPILPILGYDELDDAIALINGKPKPLALYIYSRDKAAIRHVLTHTTAGDTCINHNMVHFLHQNLPFGGVNNSGIGKSHGFHGFVAFSHERSILQDRLTIFHWLFPPYTAAVQWLIRFAKNHLT